MRVASDDAFPHTVTLKDDSKVLIRRAGPEDFQMLFSMFTSLSDETMFSRSPRSQKELSKRDAQEILRLDEIAL